MRCIGGVVALALLAGATVLIAERRDDRVCGVQGEKARQAARRGLVRDHESRRAMALLDVDWSTDARTSALVFLGYPNLGLDAIERATTPWTDDATGLHRTYAEDGDDDPATCDGDFRFRLDGHHAPLTAAALGADLDALVARVRPTDVYTHVVFDGHPDHAVVARQVAAALARSGLSGTVHGTLMHPEGSGPCMGPSAARWPNPPLADDDPFARFTPALDVAPPPVPPCDEDGVGEATSWGPDGPPDEWVEVPAAMRTPVSASNLKWRVIATYASQVDCERDASGRWAPSCGYMRAFVKRREFFWTAPFGAPPRPAAGPVLVVAAHPDDEALGAAGVIASARVAGRAVVVAVVTNGDATLP